MNKSIQVFKYEGSEVRTVEINGEVWFVGKDVATVLGYQRQADAIAAHVEEEDKGVGKIPTPGGVQDMTVINESGLYSLIFSSQLPTAKQFKHWVTSEVLPQIHKTGSYSPKHELPGITPEIINSAKTVYQLAGIEGNQLVLAVDKYFKSYTGRSALEVAGIRLEAPTKHQILTPTEISEYFGGLSAIRVNEMLANAGFQHKIAGRWEPSEDGLTYAVMQDTGKRYSDGTPIRQLKWDSSILTHIGG